MFFTGDTDKTVDVFIQDSSSTTGAGLTGLVHNSAGLVCYYRKGATGSATALTLVTQTVGGAHTDGGFVEISAANMPGHYRLDLSDAVIDTMGFVTLHLKGATNMAPVTIRIPVWSATRGTAGTALPAVAADAAGGLPISDAGGLDLDNRMPSSTATSNINIVFATDFAANYDTVNDRWADNVGVGTLLGRLSATRAGYLDNLSGGAVALASALATAQADLTALVGRLTAARAGYLDNLNVGGAVASQADINALNQSASRRIILTTIQQYERPESGSTVFWIEARTYDGDGAPVNADSTPTLTATGVVTGDLSANLSVASNPSTGVYRWTYTVDTAHALEQIRFDISATMTTVFTLSVMAHVCDFVATEWTTTDQANLTAVFNKMPTKAKVAGTDNTDGDIQLDEATGNLAWNPAWDVEVQSEVNDALIAFPWSAVSILHVLGDVDGDIHGSVQGNVDGTAGGLSDAGVSLTDVPWNPAWAVQVRASVGLATANLDTQIGDIPTNGEMANVLTTGTRFLTMIQVSGGNYKFTVDALSNAPSGGGGSTPGLTLHSGTVSDSLSNSPTTVVIGPNSFAENSFNDRLFVIKDLTDDTIHSRWVFDYATTGTLVTLYGDNPLPFTPDDTDEFWILSNIKVPDNELVLIKTTIASLTSQTVFVLTEGSIDPNAYLGLVIQVDDSAIGVQKGVRRVTDYTGGRQVTVDSAFDFTISANDNVIVYAVPYPIAGGGGSGSGARTISGTVNDGALPIPNPLENATVRYTAGAFTFTTTTNADGEFTPPLNIDDETYTVAITKAGYTFPGATHIVAADSSPVYSMDLNTPPLPSLPSRTTGLFYLYDSLLQPVNAGTVYMRMKEPPEGTFGSMFNRSWFELTSAADGLVEVELVKGATYERGLQEIPAERIVIPADAGDSYNLPDVTDAVNV